MIVPDADSLDEVTDTFYPVRYLEDVVEKIGGKTDTVLKLASCVYQILLSAEEHGFFMMLDNWTSLIERWTVLSEH